MLFNNSYYAKLKYVLSVLVTLFAINAFAQQNDGSALYKQCIACHGQSGEGNAALNSPAIAGLKAWYVERQLSQFKSGIRAGKAEDTIGKQMVPFAQSLANEQQVAAVAAYIESMSLPKSKHIVTGDIRRGTSLYMGNCGACHGGKGEGNKTLSAPRLANQDSKYLIRQIKQFKSGLRGYDKSDKLGRQMAMMANTISDKDLIDIISYLQSVE